MSKETPLLFIKSKNPYLLKGFLEPPRGLEALGTLITIQLRPFILAYVYVAMSLKLSDFVCF